MPEAIHVQRDEYVFGADDDRLVFTGEHLQYVDADGGPEIDAERIPATDVTGVRTEADASVTGFHVIGIAIALVALLFTVATARLVLGGAAVSLATVGSALCAAFGWLAASQYFRVEGGELTVIVVETATEEFVFYTQAGVEEVEAVVEAMREHESRHPERVRETAPQ